MPPLVSILLPNLNNRPFLEERIATILGQTFRDWELLVYDGYSDDGAWEFFEALAPKDSRIAICQAPREGIYPAWNECIRRATGRYLYIATSDDTMALDCLDKMVRALEEHPECDLAHCPLRVIDAAGGDMEDWWSRNSMFAWSSRGLLDRNHVRLAPFDGLLHLAGQSVYISVTQLLIRRSLFDRVGLFESRWGAMGDFNWNMRAALVASTVHVPDTWGGWRVHANQATAATGANSPQYWQKLDEMIDDAIGRSRVHLAGPVRQRLDSRWASLARDARHTCRELNDCQPSLQRRTILLRRLLGGSWAARQWFKARLTGQAFGWPETAPTTIVQWLKSAGLERVLIPY